MSHSLPLAKPSEVLNENDCRILSYLNRVGYTAPIVLRGKFEVSQKSIQDTLQRLYLCGYIMRPLKGLVCSKVYFMKNPNERHKFERTFGLLLPIPNKEN